MTREKASIPARRLRMGTRRMGNSAHSSTVYGLCVSLGVIVLKETEAEAVLARG
jgi:hypothetical protein